MTVHAFRGIGQFYLVVKILCVELLLTSPYLPCGVCTINRDTSCFIHDIRSLCFLLPFFVSLARSLSTLLLFSKNQPFVTFWFLVFVFPVFNFTFYAFVCTSLLLLAFGLFFSLSFFPPRLLIRDFPSFLMRTFSDTNFFSAVFHLCLTN